MHMMETIAVLLIFFILVLIGFVFYGRIMKGNIEVLNMVKAIVIVLILSMAVYSLTFVSETEIYDENGWMNVGASGLIIFVAGMCIVLLGLEYYIQRKRNMKDDER